MLDQNTDRMWYVIGAVIIGAAIIFIMNGTMPELFASVGETFENKAKETTEMIDATSENHFNVDTAKPGWMLYWATGQEGVVEGYKSNVISDYIEVEPGSIYRSNYQPQVYYYDEQKQYIGAFHSNPYTFTIPMAGEEYQYPNAHVDERTPSFIRIRYGGPNDTFIQDHDLDTIRLVKLN